MQRGAVSTYFVVPAPAPGPAAGSSKMVTFYGGATRGEERTEESATNKTIYPTRAV